MAVPQPYRVSGKAAVTNASASADVIAAASGKTYNIQRGVVGITLAATGGGGIVSLCDDTTPFISWDINSVKEIDFDFGDVGYPLTSGKACKLIVSGAATTQGSANCALVGYQV